MARVVCGVQVWRWLAFFAFMAAIGSAVLMFLIAFSAWPLLVSLLTFVIGAGAYAAFIACQGAGAWKPSLRDRNGEDIPW